MLTLKISNFLINNLKITGIKNYPNSFSYATYKQKILQDYYHEDKS
jgi:hypothetical protein